ncbi:hypothetical protein COU74_05255 [Candidatus Peregrinibacteria bacterium CG10_big_fil_rev_8_21_14_0_10_36_19]|nr:MAG: hypothetical protein COU74_05255 [Candidatus Peregrinibacteria bacterium CG10_big_fil_rev_8_21_14_0_10_36_19]
MNKQISVVLVAAGICFGVLMSWQFASDAPSDSNFLADEISARENLIKGFLDEQTYLQSRIVFLRKEIEREQDLIKSQGTESSLTELEKLKRILGLSEITGKGLEVTLNDSPIAVRQGEDISSKGLIQAADIRDVVNLMNAASADAISVNGQRIIASSPISSVGTTILVNNSYISPPFVVSAIGDPEIMIQRLSNRAALPELYKRVQESKVSMKVSLREWVRIPIYNGDLKYNYINLVE